MDSSDHTATWLDLCTFYHSRMVFSKEGPRTDSSTQEDSPCAFGFIKNHERVASICARAYVCDGSLVFDPNRYADLPLFGNSKLGRAPFHNFVGSWASGHASPRLAFSLAPAGRTWAEEIEFADLTACTYRARIAAPRALVSGG